MKGTIAIQKDLTPVRDYLAGKGYHVESINLDEQQSASKLRNYDAIVLSGENSDFLGYEETRTKAVVINASGLTPEEVAGKIEASG
ncbi:YkuS family protein [Caproicibacter sp.]|uniref:YkuS family protein n=1 Tax=Caproicibacter sp. TaxID=2814884 RepID=UPI003989C91C